MFTIRIRCLSGLSLRFENVLIEHTQHRFKMFRLDIFATLTSRGYRSSKYIYKFTRLQNKEIRWNVLTNSKWTKAVSQFIHNFLMCVYMCVRVLYRLTVRPVSSCWLYVHLATVGNVHYNDITLPRRIDLNAIRHDFFHWLYRFSIKIFFGFRLRRNHVVVL